VVIEPKKPTELTAVIKKENYEATVKKIMHRDKQSRP
jgi:hypothetical protein